MYYGVFLSPSTSIKELEKQGWTKRFAVEEQRAAEYKENYETIGFEVLILPSTQVEEDLPSDECVRLETCNLVTIFTRKKKTN